MSATADKVILRQADGKLRELSATKEWNDHQVNTIPAPKRPNTQQRLYSSKEGKKRNANYSLISNKKANIHSLQSTYNIASGNLS